MSLTTLSSEETINFLADEKELSHQERDELKIKQAQVESPLTHYQLQDVLLWVDDIMDRGKIQWVLVGDLAQQIHDQNDPTLQGEKIEIQVLRNNMTESGRSMISSWIPNTRDESLTDIEFEYKTVPIHIKIIDKDPGYLSNPDTRFYYVSNINIPNPWEAYINDRTN